jgi:hypothetical protein
MRAYPVPLTSGYQRPAGNGERWPYSSRLPLSSSQSQTCPGAVLISQRRIRVLYSERRIVGLVAPCRR